MIYTNIIKSNVLAALQSAEGEDGPDGLDYIRLMGELAVICSSRAQECAKRMESESAGRPGVPLRFSWTIYLRRTTTYFQEKSVMVFAATRSEAESMAKDRAVVAGFWDECVDQGHARYDPEVTGTVKSQNVAVAR